MFRKLTSPSAPGHRLTVYIDNEPTDAYEGETLAGALLRQASAIARTTPVKGTPRAPFCMMGVCFDCLAIVDGVASTQTCLVTVRDGMRVERQHGRRDSFSRKLTEPCSTSTTECSAMQTEAK